MRTLYTWLCIFTTVCAAAAGDVAPSAPQVQRDGAGIAQQQHDSEGSGVAARAARKQAEGDRALHQRY